MRYRQLGRTGVKVSELCLGTMTFGEQNSEAEGHAQMDHSVDCGINIFDAAEIYPVPPKPETQGRTEMIIGTWLARQKKRDKVLIATKIAGRGTADWLREDRSLPRQSPAQIKEAVEASLQRLRTDYIDLYQLHWPDRPMRVFQGLEYVHLGGEAHPIPELLGAQRPHDGPALEPFHRGKPAAQPAAETSRQVGNVQPVVIGGAQHLS